MRVHNRNLYPLHLQEPKFYLPYGFLLKNGYTKSTLDYEFSIHSPIIRSQTLKLVRDYCDGIYIAVLDKQSVKDSTWTAERLGNFVFGHTLLSNVLKGLSLPQIPLICYDEGRLSPAKSADFQDYVISKDSYFEYRGFKQYNGNSFVFNNTCSVSEPCLWAADLVAGAFYHKYANNEWSYANILMNKLIGNGARIFWN
jgi:hypothetical protein